MRGNKVKYLAQKPLKDGILSAGGSSLFFKRCVRDKELLLMALLPVAWYLIFCYGPMYGIIIAFKTDIRYAHGADNYLRGIIL